MFQRDFITDDQRMRAMEIYFSNGFTIMENYIKSLDISINIRHKLFITFQVLTLDDCFDIINDKIIFKDIYNEYKEQNRNNNILLTNTQMVT